MTDLYAFPKPGDTGKSILIMNVHLLADTLGIPLSYSVTPADMHDTQGARRLLGGLKYSVPRREDHLGGQRVSWQGRSGLVQSGGWLGPRKWSGMFLE